MVATIVNGSPTANESQSLLPNEDSEGHCDAARGNGDGSQQENFFHRLTLAGTILMLLCIAAAIAFQANPSRAGSGGITHGVRKEAKPGNQSSGVVNHEGVTDTETKCWWTSPNVETTTTDLPGLIPDHLLRNRTSRRLRWGVLGLGRIANDFTTALKMAGADITAVAAGSLPNATERAKKFAKRYSVPKSYGTYEGIAKDPMVDIVYIATINPLHLEPTIMMLKAGKNVLVEKPMAMTIEEAESMAQAAKEANRLLVTNFWTRFFPVTKYIRHILAGQRLGKTVAMRGDFGFVTPPDPSDRWLDRSKGGGTMLDLGCYLVNLAVMASATTDLPVDIQASAQRTYLGVDYNVDTETSFILKWDSHGNQSTKGTLFGPNATDTTMIMSGQTSFRRPSSFEVEIEGADGRLKIHGPANAPNRSTIYEYGTEGLGSLRRIELVGSELPAFDKSYGPKEYPRGEGFVYVINELEQCMFENGIPGADEMSDKEGCLSLDELPMNEQLNTVRITDEILRKFGYRDWA